MGRMLLPLLFAVLFLAGCATTQGTLTVEGNRREVYVGPPGSWWDCEIDAVDLDDSEPGHPGARIRVSTPLPTNE